MSEVDEEPFEDIIDNGEEVCWQDWDSGGPGAGAGRVSIYRYKGVFYALHDAGLDGPYRSKDEAVAHNGVLEVGSATVAIWDTDNGYIFRR